MPRQAASTASRGQMTRPSDAQENQEPVRVRAGTQFPLSGADAAVKGAAARTPTSSDPSHRKHRRALHAIDSNRLPASCPSSSALKRTEATAPSSGLKALLKTSQPLNHDAEVAARTPDSADEPPASHAGVKRVAASPADTLPSIANENSPSDAQTSENLAWMDMLLALLEKRYGSKASVPVNVADLEAACMFQSQRKRFKADDSTSRSSVMQQDAIHQSRTSQNSSQPDFQAINPSSSAPAAAATSAPLVSAHMELEERDKAREDKRQRLLLRHALQIQASSVSSATCCGCKTGCLKMYCVCFSSRGFCHASCACEDCKNSRAHQPQRLAAIQSYLANNPRAFSYAPQTQDAGSTGFLHLLPQKSSAVVLRGCRCKKSKCLKKYCDCFQNGLACSAHCRCVDCANHSKAATSRRAAKSAVGAAAAMTHSRSHSHSQTTTTTPFHAVQLTVTKQPRRNRVLKTLRLSL